MKLNKVSVQKSEAPKSSVLNTSAKNTAVKSGAGFNALSSFANTVANVVGRPLQQQSGTGGTVPPPWSYPNAANIARIAAMQDPVLRNRAITQGYSDLSAAMGKLLGTDNANWATYAAWASKQAGVAIAGDPRAQALQSFATTAYNQMADEMRKRGLTPPPLDQFVNDVANDANSNISQALAEGNQAVFAEIGPKFAAFVQTFGGATQYNQAQVDAFIAQNFPPDPQHTPGSALDRGPNGPVANAFRLYAQAQFETNPDRKAELMCQANAMVGQHEQAVLQPYIERALNAPLEAVTRQVERRIAEAVAALPDGVFKTADEIAFIVDHGVVNAVRDAVQPLARGALTRWMMDLSLPNETLHLGQDVPLAPGQSSPFPPALGSLDPDTQALLDQFGAGGSNLTGTGATDWADYSQRMKYIASMFRSRQQDPSLFRPPFGRPGVYDNSGGSAAVG